MPLTKETRSLLDMAYRVGAPRFHELAVAQARHSAQKLHFAFRPEAPAVASTAEVPIPRPDTSALLARLLDPDPHARPQHAEWVARELAALLDRHRPSSERASGEQRDPARGVLLYFNGRAVAGTRVGSDGIWSMLLSLGDEPARTVVVRDRLTQAILFQKTCT